MSNYQEFKKSLIESNLPKLKKGKFGVLKGKYKGFNFLVTSDEDDGGGYWGYVIDDEPKPQAFGSQDPIEFSHSTKTQAVKQAMKIIDRKEK